MNQQTESQESRYIRKVMEAAIRIGIVAILALWSFSIFKPFLGPVVWGVIIAIACNGIYVILCRALGGKKGLAATCFAILLIAILVTPTVILSDSLLTSAQELSSNLQTGEIDIPPPPQGVAEWPIIGERVYASWQLASTNLKAAADAFQPQIEAFSKALLSRALGAGVDILLFIVSIILAAIFLANGKAAADVARQIFVRLAGDKGGLLVDLGRDTVMSVAKGVLGIAVIQTLFLAIGLIAAGVPAAGLLTVITLLFAIAQIPMLLLYLPIVAFYFSTAEPTAAVIFAIWSVFFSFADGFLKPLLLGRGLTVPMPVILIGVIGGMVANGIIGLFIGPIVLAFSYKLFMVWLEGETVPAAAKSNAEQS